MITRDEAIEWLQLAKLKVIAQSAPPTGKLCQAYDMAIEALKQPEIIRCKDCKYCVDYGMGEYYCESEDIVPVGNYVEPGGFCNFAGRREE